MTLSHPPASSCLGAILCIVASKQLGYTLCDLQSQTVSSTCRSNLTAPPVTARHWWSERPQQVLLCLRSLLQAMNPENLEFCPFACRLLARLHSWHSLLDLQAQLPQDLRLHQLLRHWAQISGLVRVIGLVQHAEMAYAREGRQALC